MNEKKEEQHGSLSYVPKDVKKDTQLQYAIKLLHGEVTPPPMEEKKSSELKKPAEKTAAKKDSAPVSLLLRMSLFQQKSQYHLKSQTHLKNLLQNLIKT